MTCIHGLDEIFCPICRIHRSILPLNLIGRFRLNISALRPEKEFLQKILNRREDFKKKAFHNSFKVNESFSPLIHELKVPILNNKFENIMFHKRLKEIDVNNLDEHGISRKIKLNNGKLDLKK
ncbi:MAG: hypothetical protein ACTSVX_09810 [Promethearchaeota archaeon]